MQQFHRYCSSKLLTERSEGFNLIFSWLENTQRHYSYLGIIPSPAGKFLCNAKYREFM